MATKPTTLSRHLRNGYGMAGGRDMFAAWLSPAWYLEQAEGFERAAIGCRRANLELGRSQERAEKGASFWLKKAQFCRDRASGKEPMPKILFIGAPDET